MGGKWRCVNGIVAAIGLAVLANSKALNAAQIPVDISSGEITISDTSGPLAHTPQNLATGDLSLKANSVSGPGAANLSYTQSGGSLVVAGGAFFSGLTFPEGFDATSNTQFTIDLSAGETASLNFALNNNNAGSKFTTSLTGDAQFTIAGPTSQSLEVSGSDPSQTQTVTLSAPGTYTVTLAAMVSGLNQQGHYQYILNMNSDPSDTFDLGFASAGGGKGSGSVGSDSTPLPPAVWSSLTLLIGLGAIRAVSRRVSLSK